MDGDDRCDKERFAIEINVLEKEPEISIVSTDMEFLMKVESGEKLVIQSIRRRKIL